MGTDRKWLLVSLILFGFSLLGVLGMVLGLDSFFYQEANTRVLIMFMVLFFFGLALSLVLSISSFMVSKVITQRVISYIQMAFVVISVLFLIFLLYIRFL